MPQKTRLPCFAYTIWLFLNPRLYILEIAAFRGTHALRFRILLFVESGEAYEAARFDFKVGGA